MMGALQEEWLRSPVVVGSDVEVIPLTSVLLKNVLSWPSHVDVWQKPTQFCEAIILN